jgi:hypothetical protein
MSKVIKDGKVAVLVSSDYGAGFVTWNPEVSPFEPTIVNAVLNGIKGKELKQIVLSIYPECFTGGVCDLIIEWIPEGVEFILEEYDGSESVTFMNDMKVYKA